jgi:hypothetical protein
MNRFFVRFVILVCLVSAWHLVLDESKAVRAQGKNFLRPDKSEKTTPGKKAGRNDDDKIRQIRQSLAQAFDPETKQSGGTKAVFYYGIFFVGVGAVAAGLLGWRIWQRRQLDRERNDPMILIQELNSAHQLSSQEKRLMQDLSVKNSLQSPLKLFVEPKYFLDAMESRAFASSRPVMRSLLSKLFGIEAAIGEISAAGTNSETALFSSKVNA